MPHGDIIERFLDLTSDDLSPSIFRLWSGISLVAGALERRVWTRTGPRITYPNLYVLLVADPGVGKYVISRVRELWERTKEPGGKKTPLHVAPDNITKASMLDNLAKAKRSFFGPHGATEYQSMLVAAEEFGVLLPGYDLEFIGVLNSIYNNPNRHTESRRTSTVKELELIQPQLNILGGVQPGWLASVFPEEAWSMGLSSRMIMVYSAEGVLRDLFAVGQDYRSVETELLTSLSRLSDLQGEFEWTAKAQRAISEWHLAGGPPTPEHSKLTHYNRRRALHMLKIMMVSAASAGRMSLLEEDFQRGLGWLTTAEAYMPDIFRAMIGRSDHAILEELGFYLQQMWIRNSKKPLTGNMMYQFLGTRVPADKVPKLVDLAVKAGVIEWHEQGNMLIPKARFGLGPE